MNAIFSRSVSVPWPSVAKSTGPLTFQPLRKILTLFGMAFLEHSLFGKLFDFVLISLVMNLYFLNANPSIFHEPFNLVSRKFGLFFQLSLQCFHLDRPKGVRYPLLPCFHLFLTSKSEPFSRKSLKNKTKNPQTSIAAKQTEKPQLYSSLFSVL